MAFLKTNSKKMVSLSGAGYPTTALWREIAEEVAVTNIRPTSLLREALQRIVYLTNEGTLSEYEGQKLIRYVIAGYTKSAVEKMVNEKILKPLIMMKSM